MDNVRMRLRAKKALQHPSVVTVELVSFQTDYNATFTRRRRKHMKNCEFSGFDLVDRESSQFSIVYLLKNTCVISLASSVSPSHKTFHSFTAYCDDPMLFEKDPFGHYHKFAGSKKDSSPKSWKAVSYRRFTIGRYTGADDQEKTNRRGGYIKQNPLTGEDGRRSKYMPKRECFAHQRSGHYELRVARIDDPEFPMNFKQRRE
jgi:hypothetical protein